MHEPRHHQVELDWAGGRSLPADDATSPFHAHATDEDGAGRRALAGAIAFLSPEAQLQRTAELLGEGALVVAVPPLPPAMRGHLAEHLEEHLERELAAHGAPSPYLAAWSAMPDDAEERLADQLFRARSVGASGIALALGSISAAACPALTPEDSATLRWLAQATSRAPLSLIVDDADSFAVGYEAPIALTSLLEGARGPVAEAPAPTTIEESASDPPPPLPAEAATPSPHDDGERARDLRTPLDRAMAGVPTAGPHDFWRSWAIALGAVRGPLPLGAFERLFAESYMPLANAIACGLDDPRALRAHDEFRRTFERAYADAFATFGATNRRPRLVMDAHEIAAKQARLHNARSAQVLVVDSLRWDLGSHFRDALLMKASGASALISEGALWSALPTTTLRQLETIARGIDALRAPAADDGQESLRGRSAEVVRRLRVGSRELYKLDIVPAVLGSLGDEPGAEHVVRNLEGIADEVAGSVARHLANLPPRTLLFVVGDHGFTVDRRGRILHGGASPEEVIVPTTTWLTGELH